MIQLTENNKRNNIILINWGVKWSHYLKIQAKLMKKN